MSLSWVNGDKTFSIMRILYGLRFLSLNMEGGGVLLMEMCQISLLIGGEIFALFVGARTLPHGLSRFASGV